MKLSQLKTIVKEAVREAIQEEMKDILMEAVRSPKQTVYEHNVGTPRRDIYGKQSTDVAAPTPMSTDNRMAMRENIQNVLGGMMPGKNGTMSATTNSMPLQVSGKIDTTSPNGSLPEGNVSMDQIMGLMNK
tara:strand:+ start:2993 stop:3385 length:393 start_codon:yes stop_codon:yes gene_type:complete